MIRVYACLFVALSLLSGCGRYADFVLPPPESSGPRGPFTWSALPSPVIPRDDVRDVLNPSVIKSNGEYLNFYSVYGGANWTTASARSADGVTWQKRGPVELAPEGGIAANGSALMVAGEIFYWFQTGAPPHIAIARQLQNPQRVLEPGPLGSFDEFAVADPDVIHIGDRFYLYYLGQDRARRQRLGVARSTDGIHWQKYRGNPILELGAPGAFDENGLGEPAVWSSGGSYWMLYTGRDRNEHRRIGLARSPDGVNWTRDLSLKPIEGTAAWDSAVVCDPSVEVLPDQVRVWFGGGDVPDPDHGIHGQIGLGFLKPAAVLK